MMRFRRGGVGHNQREATNHFKTDRDRLDILQTEDLVNKTRNLEGMEVEGRVGNSNVPTVDDEEDLHILDRNHICHSI